MNCTCLIPFFNEHDRILNVLDQVARVKSINDILCVDDGSTDGTAKLIKKHYPNIKLISNAKNLGKTETIKIGLKHSHNNYVLLLDADLRNLNYQEINDAVVKIQGNVEIDMIILRRINAPLLIKLNRGDTLLSGERILKKEDLKKILKDENDKPKGFQLEFAINKYMMDNHKKVYWMQSSALNTWPIQKRGFLKGLYAIFSMQVNILSYIGFKNFIFQELFFCKRRLI